MDKRPAEKLKATPVSRYILKQLGSEAERYCTYLPKNLAKGMGKGNRN